MLVPAQVVVVVVVVGIADPGNFSRQLPPHDVFNIAKVMILTTAKADALYPVTRAVRKSLILTFNQL
ncbi:hypothetical protein SAMN05216516_11321 [Izhakiella capsodis]|uniref:Uncharacterized protein n=1 Tax=Izhakiella capsodis TaxID=1367852 RepID=A0A1I5ATP8_9GAMM|nr:hypothetical protein [Izhakiella capsodis]SFN65780.1 hypothetical protein SAMN05216516_11321 [Izhakiella capsodis]